jgi:hypothetical protein
MEGLWPYARAKSIHEAHVRERVERRPRGAHRRPAVGVAAMARGSAQIPGGAARGPWRGPAGRRRRASPRTRRRAGRRAVCTNCADALGRAWRGALRGASYSTSTRFRVFVLVQDAMGNLFECEYRIFGANCPIAQLESIMRRHRMTLRKTFQNTSR